MGKIKSILIASLTLASLANGAQAVTTYTNGTLIVIEGNPQPNETNIFMQGLPNATDRDGNVGSQSGTDLIHFKTTTPVDFSNGFATITTCNSCSPAPLIHNVTITSPTGLLWNDMLFGALPTSAHSSDLTITAFLGGQQLGQVFIANIGNGLDPLLTMIAVSGVMDKLVLTSDFGVAQFKQFEISFAPVPLPPAAILFGTALVGLVTLGRRRRSDRLAQ